MPVLSAILVVTFLWSPIAARQVHQADSTNNPNTSLSLQLRLHEDRTKFHVGEIIPVELSFTSNEHKKYTIMAFECGDNYKYHVEPALFLNRDTGMGVWEECSGPIIDIDPGEKPFTVEQILNSGFRMDTPGRYRISVTSTRLGLAVTSNTVELEITPADSAWQESELHRALELIALRTERSLKQGCAALRYLETNAAAVEIARLYADLTSCVSFTDLDTAVISAPNRAEVLNELHAGIAEPERPISTSYLRTIAIVSLYQEHPEWVPRPRVAAELDTVSLAGLAGSNGLLQRREALPNREIDYAKELAAALPKKAPEARAKSLETLLYLGKTLAPVEIPPELMKAAQGEVAANFGNLPAGDQNYVLRQLWPAIKSPAMIPVLEKVVNGGFVPASNWPQSVALRRLCELSPEVARPYILRELRSDVPRIDTSVLGLLPEKELPELDSIMVSRVLKSRDDGYRAMATALVQRYASAGIAKDLRPFMDQNIGNMTCESAANLLVYFLRVAPEDGSRLLNRAMQARGTLSCRDNLIQRLAGIRMSPEVEQAAIAALNDSDLSVAHEALNVLREDGSADCKAAILRSFRQWHQQWEGRAKDLNTPANVKWQLDEAYYGALAFAQGWVSSKEELEALRDLCLSEACKQEADSALIYRPQTYVMIAVVEPAGDEFSERFMPGGTMERMQQKMAQYPKGTLFQIDGRFAAYDSVQRFFNELKPWTADHGYLLQIYQN